MRTRPESREGAPGGPWSLSWKGAANGVKVMTRRVIPVRRRPDPTATRVDQPFPDGLISGLRSSPVLSSTDTAQVFSHRTFVPIVQRSISGVASEEV